LVTNFTVFLLLATLIQVFFWVYFFQKLAKFRQNKPLNHQSIPITVLVCVKNDLHHLRLSFSRYNWVLLTDADCQAFSDKWAKTMISSAIDHQKSIVLGYSPYAIPVKSTLFMWIHFEAWITGLLYLSFCLRGLPYMGVGRNLLYDKRLITEKVLAKNKDIISGDDDLLISQISNPNNTTICIDPNSFVYSSPEKSWSSYFNQKLRHYTTASRYKFKHKFLLTLFSLSQIAFYIFIILSLLNGDILLGLVCYISRIIIVLPIVQKNIKQLKAEFTLSYFLLLDVMLSFYYIIFSFSFILPKFNRWK